MESGSSIVTILEDGITRSVNMEQPFFFDNNELHDYQANSASRGYKLIISNRAC